MNSTGGLQSWQSAVGRGAESNEHFLETGQGSRQLSPWEPRVMGAVNRHMPGSVDWARGKPAEEGLVVVSASHRFQRNRR